MKLFIICVAAMLAGCSTVGKEQLYYEASKSISKDQTMAQAACWSAISEIAKNADSSVRINAIALAEKCKSETVKIEAPRKSWFPF